MTTWSSGPAPMYPGDGWEAYTKNGTSDQARWFDVILFMPTDKSVDVLLALNNSEPRWYRGIKVRRKQ